MGCGVSMDKARGVIRRVRSLPGESIIRMAFWSCHDVIVLRCEFCYDDGGGRGAVMIPLSCRYTGM